MKYSKPAITNLGVPHAYGIFCGSGSRAIIKRCGKRIR